MLPFCCFVMQDFAVYLLLSAGTSESHCNMKRKSVNLAKANQMLAQQARSVITKHKISVTNAKYGLVCRATIKNVMWELIPSVKEIVRIHHRITILIYSVADTTTLLHNKGIMALNECKKI